MHWEASNPLHEFAKSNLVIGKMDKEQVFLRERGGHVNRTPLRWARGVPIPRECDRTHPSGGGGRKRRVGGGLSCGHSLGLMQ